MIETARIARVVRKGEVKLVDIPPRRRAMCSTRRMPVSPVQPGQLHIRDSSTQTDPLHIASFTPERYSSSSASIPAPPALPPATTHFNSPLQTHNPEKAYESLLQYHETRTGSATPASTEPSRTPSYTYPAASSISVEKLRQSFQQQDGTFTSSPATMGHIPSMQLPAPSGHIRRARLPPQRRVATTPTAHPSSTSEPRILPQSRTFSDFEHGSNPSDGCSQTSTGLKVMSPNTGRSSDSQICRSLTTSQLSDRLEGSAKACAPMKAELTTGKKISSKIPSPMKNTTRQSTLRFASTPVLPSEKKEVYSPVHNLNCIHLTLSRMCLLEDCYALSLLLKSHFQQCRSPAPRHCFLRSPHLWQDRLKIYITDSHP